MNATTQPEITMIEQTETNATPPTPVKPIAEYALLGTVLQAIDGYIKAVVEREFARLIEAKKTLALMDEGLRDAITEMIDDKISEHEREKDHIDEGDMEYQIDHYLRNSNEVVSERRVGEIVNDALEEVLEDRINDALSNATVSISI